MYLAVHCMGEEEVLRCGENDAEKKEKVGDPFLRIRMDNRKITRKTVEEN